MLKFQTRVVVTTYLLADVLATAVAWVLAYALRFHGPIAALVPVTKGVPPLGDYLQLLPFMAVLWPAILYFHGLYRLHRGRSRIDELFAIVFSVLIAAAVTLGATLYVRVYYRFQPDVAPRWEYSQAVFALFVALDVVAIAAARAALRAYQERQWAAGLNVTRIVVAGTGPLARTVGEALLAHRQLGYRLVGHLAEDGRRDAPVGAAPVLGSLDDARGILEEHDVDQLYVALHPEHHGQLVRLVTGLSNECVDVKVVPDVIQYATIKAALEDLDGIPIISLNEVPLQGWNSMVKRLMDVAVSAALLGALIVIPVLPVIALLIRLFGGRGPILLRQERMTLDGRSFQIFKFRTMVEDAERETGPVFATSDDPRRTPIGAVLRKHNLDEFPQLINVLIGDMSLVGPRPERPPFVQQFREKIPQYMRRHRVKSGMTGWAQVNGWRGNTSIEKRIEHDLYYIENWSLLLDLKILILTVFRGFGQKHAY
ncbi:MAG: undecaprenyl-phosphate glucose phosphotransferase [Vicinamibacteria bacterium]